MRAKGGGLTVEDPDDLGRVIMIDEQYQLPDAVKTVVETPSSLANDSQLH